MKTLITGGAGFIGFHTARFLVSQGHIVTLVDNLSRGIVDHELKALLENENVNFVDLDLSKEESYQKLHKDFDYIFHYAAIIGVQYVLKAPYDVLDINTKLLSEAIKFAKQNKNLKRFCFTSTSEIYAGTLKRTS